MRLYRSCCLFLATLSLSLTLSSCAALAGKTVAAKEPPNILIAVDGSFCMVTKQQFDNTEVGMKALCSWHGGRFPKPPATSLSR